ncbi:MAG TPA: hypothetical protein VEX15_23960, partial [Nocardioidaceae bacterium]|nr:hypothetical protein [Nocardioidaceae bacterium]
MAAWSGVRGPALRAEQCAEVGYLVTVGSLLMDGATLELDGSGLRGVGERRRGADASDRVNKVRHRHTALSYGARPVRSSGEGGAH